VDEWFVLVTNSQRTGRIVRSLESLNIPFFAPRTLSSLGRKIWLFPTYIFSLLSENHSVHDFWSIKGVRHVLPLSKPDVQRLEALQSRVKDNLLLTTTPSSRYYRGQPLLITDGPFRGHKAVYDIPVSSVRHQVTITCFGRETKVSVEESFLVST